MEVKSIIFTDRTGLHGELNDVKNGDPSPNVKKVLMHRLPYGVQIKYFTGGSHGVWREIIVPWQKIEKIIVR